MARSAEKAAGLYSKLSRSSPAGKREDARNWHLKVERPSLGTKSVCGTIAADAVLGRRLICRCGNRCVYLGHFVACDFVSSRGSRSRRRSRGEPSGALCDGQADLVAIPRRRLVARGVTMAWRPSRAAARGRCCGDGSSCLPASRGGRCRLRARVFEHRASGAADSTRRSLTRTNGNDQVGSALKVWNLLPHSASARSVMELGASPAAASAPSGSPSATSFAGRSREVPVDSSGNRACRNAEIC